MQVSNSLIPPEHPKVEMSLRSIFPAARFFHCDDIKFQGLESDSRRVKHGQLFVCLKGQSSDGHIFAKDAISGGASGLLVGHVLPEIVAPQCVVSNTRYHYGLLCQELFGHPSQKLNIMGVTGTNGKTTTVHLVQQLLSALGQKCGCLGTVHNSDGVHIYPSSMTTPAAYELAGWMQQMVVQQTGYLAMEVSSHALDQERLAGVALAAAVITNITHDHLDYHSDYDSYISAKSKIEQLLSSSGRIFINADDPGCQKCMGQFKQDANYQTFGESDRAELKIKLLNSTIQGTSFSLTQAGQKYDFESPLIGKHNVYNLAGALAMLQYLGFDLEQLRAYTPLLKPAPGRLELVEAGQEFSVFIDYAHTPDAIEHLLKALRPLTQQRLICLLGAGGDRDKTKRPLMGAAGQLADILIITSDNPRSEDPLQIMLDIQAGCLPDKNQVLMISDRREAISQACKIAQVGDIVVIAGKGHESTQTIGKTKLQFNDKTVLEDILTTEAISHPNFPT